MAWINSLPDGYMCTVSNKQQRKRKDADEHHEDGDKKLKEEGHISRLRNMLRPMSLSLFFRSSDINKDHWTLCRLSSGENKRVKSETRRCGAWRRRPKWPGRIHLVCFVLLSTTWDVFSHTVRHILYTNIAKKNIDIVIFFFYSLYKGMNLWSWLKWPF